jgi:hypothetical protein
MCSLSPNYNYTAFCNLFSCRIERVCVKTLRDGKPSFGQSETAQAALAWFGYFLNLFNLTPVGMLE